MAPLQACGLPLTVIDAQDVHSARAHTVAFHHPQNVPYCIFSTPIGRQSAQIRAASADHEGAAWTECIEILDSRCLLCVCVLWITKEDLIAWYNLLQLGCPPVPKCATREQCEETNDVCFLKEGWQGG